MFRDLSKFLSQRLTFTASEVYPGLYQASKIRDEEDIEFVKDLGIKSVIDLEGGLDPGMNFLTNYLFWSIKDLPILPDLDMLFLVCNFIKDEIMLGQKVLVHCSQGLNRSALVCARVMLLYGIPGPEVIKQIREMRPGSLWNPVFADYIEKL